MRRALGNEQGAVLVEYVVALACVSMVAVGAVVALGPMLLDLYQYQRGLLLLPFP
jgi:Flp pilus assembly pilin Flp